MSVIAHVILESLLMPATAHRAAVVQIELSCFRLSQLHVFIFERESARLEVGESEWAMKKCFLSQHIIFARLGLKQHGTGIKRVRLSAIGVF